MPNFFAGIAGKSSQVPQFLLEKQIEPILCTQPRRFAVVAVAQMVARSRNCEVGTEVGYHIGHSKVFTKEYYNCPAIYYFLRISGLHNHLADDETLVFVVDNIYISF